jgi:hypothetical protein
MAPRRFQTVQKATANTLFRTHPLTKATAMKQFGFIGIAMALLLGATSPGYEHQDRQQQADGKRRSGNMETDRSTKFQVT